MSFISDTTNWVLVSGEFVATGAEKFMTIGNFYNDLNTNTQNVNPSATQNYSYYYIDDVSVMRSPTVDAGSDVSIIYGNSTQLNPSGGSSYNWMPSAGLSCTTCANPVASPTVTTTYTVIAYFPNSCDQIDSVTVTVDTDACKEIFVPSAFSPNGDGQNDVLFVHNNCI